MKKLLALTLLITLFSCSSSDDGNSNSNNSSINPPSWIQGTWLKERSGFKFSKDDFCIVALGGTIQSCFKEQLNSFSNKTKTNVTQKITDNSYSIEITLGSQIVTYKFKKNSDTQIEWINNPLGDLAKTIYTKQ